MVFPFLKGVGNELKPDSLILKKIHTDVKMDVCICLHLCLFHSSRVLNGCWQLTGQISVAREGLRRGSSLGVSLHPRFFN